MAVVDIFLKLDGIDGESQDSKHKGDIDIESWNWGASNLGTAAQAGGMGQGKVQMQDFTFVKNVDKSSPKLMQACASGQHIKSAVLVQRKAGQEQQEFLKWKLSDVMISSYQTGVGGLSVHAPGSEGAKTDRVDPSRRGLESVTPFESITLNFSKIEFEYKEQKADGTLGGSVRGGWDVKASKTF